VFRTFAEAEAFLRTREDFERRARGGWRPDLGPARALVAALGEPQRRARVLHVGGTKGKGSTATFLAEVLRASGRRVGLYTSPHLERVTERIVVDGEEIDAEAFAGAVGRAARVAEAGGEAGRASTFDVLTAAAFDHFARVGVEWAVVEVGLGGRLDSTNVVEPEVCVLTNVSLEHTEVLGDRIEEIAREKAGIVKPGIPVVTGFEGEALPVLEAACRDQGARLLRLGREFAVESVERTKGGLRVGLRTWKGGYGPVALPGSGLFQAENLAFAVAALEAAAERGVLPGLDLEAGLARAAPRLSVPGRFEVFPGEPPIVLDGAHTPESVEAALASLEGAFPGRRRVIVFGAQRDKDLRGMSSRLRGRADTVVLTALATPRAASLPALVAVAREEGLPFVEEDPRRALEVAAERAGRGGVVLALGSLHLVGALRPAVARERGRSGGRKPW
jgi:dihydrofolate synthase / folylpolyglutamate synthase